MSNEFNTTIKLAFALTTEKLTSSTDLEVWRNQIFPNAQAATPDAYDYLLSPYGPTKVYTMPEFETLKPVARVASGNFTEEQKQLPIMPTKEGDAKIYFDEFDGSIYSKWERNKDYRGEGGKLLFIEEMKIMNMDKNKLKVQCRLLFSALKASISDEFLRLLKVPPEPFEKIEKEYSVQGLLKLIEEVHQGRGEHVGLVLILKLFKMSTSVYHFF